MKALEFIYQETQIHFLLGNDKNVMVNATEMAKAFGKRTDVFLKTDNVKTFIERLNLPPNGGRLNEKIVDERGRNGIYFNRLLALKFAAWLDVDFEIWIYTCIEEILFGNYQKHWEAHMRQEAAKVRMNDLKNDLLVNPSTETVLAYFEQERIIKEAKNDKVSAIRNQYKISFE